MSKARFKVQDNRKRTCRKCWREIQKGEFAKRSEVKNRSQNRGPEAIKAMFLCQDCFTDAHGEPMMN